MSYARILAMAAASFLVGLPSLPDHPRASYPVAGKRKADPKKKAARKRQKKARMISRGRS